ncbi:hypothetical protein LOTGIDRAFT_180365 [Lottia gigantea]|uniref:Target of rapamycin complex 2 subunit MAPKAP1 n=1 Tax=Lottia gigantea TaxID=225164 RepID=V4AUC4_LOTGI|nr:hypothetical protein LOTGIDRAFT_180365 [Lottia gigantea]ESP00893.1 hypothetical protein LOTGIDRAFT_180365 [Lottia gigantea]
MAMMDNKDFLINHIRNSFITSDDTGMCELIIDGGYFGEVFGQVQGSSAHRRRSNTAQRLDRLKKEKRSHHKAKTFSWKSGNDYKVEEKGFLFERKVISPPEIMLEKQVGKKQSRLSQLIDTIGDKGDNPFMEYARYDGRLSGGVASKRIDIYLTMLLPKERAYPMPIVVLSSAKVSDMIGMICWQYTNEQREPKLKERLDNYSLHIAEDDGEVDSDFPSLDNREPVSKFGFGKLALVEKATSGVSPRALILVTIHIPNRGFNKFQVDDNNVQLRILMEKVLRRRKIKLRPGLKYNLEKLNDPGVPIDLDATLMSLDTLEFVLIRENSARDDHDKYNKSFDTSDVAESLTSHQYKSYIVNLVHRLRTNTEVHLGISGEKVEIDPVISKGASRLFRQRAVSFDADSIADCHLLEQKSNGKSIFRITHLVEPDFKHHDFEADHDTSSEIVQKINHILELRLSPARKDFVSFREKRLSMRRKDSFKSSS